MGGQREHGKLLVAGCLVIGLIGWDPGSADAQATPPSPETDAGAGAGADAGTDTGTGTGTDADADADPGTDADADPGTDTLADGPELILAPGEVDNTQADAGEYRVEIDPLRGMQQGRMRREQKTTIGGYGELHLNMVKPEDEGFASILDFHRFVIFFAHRFNDRFQFYSEVELEHAFVADSGGVAIPGLVQID